MNLEEIEVLRKKAKRRRIIGVLLGIIIPIIIIAIMIIRKAYKNIIEITAFSILLGVIISFLVSYAAIKKFKIAFKEKYVLSRLKENFTDMTYEPEEGIKEKVIADTHMMYMGNEYSANDYISAKYKNVSFIQSDILIKKVSEIDINGISIPIVKTIFTGKWMVFDFNKTFRADIQVRQTKFGNARLRKYEKKSKLAFKKVELEDEAFNKYFNVYAQNEHDAFYILTPQTMERIRRLSNEIGYKILMCFVKDKLHICIDNGKDSFEWNFFKKIDENIVNDEVTKDIRLITQFVDELKLDNELFKK